MWLKTVAFVLTAVFIIAVATMVPSFAQQAQNSATTDNTIALPISAILDSALNAHEQDIKDNIFEYKFDSAKDNPATQADLIIARSEELKKEASDNENLINVLIAKNDTFSDEQLIAMAEETNTSMEKLNNRSIKLDKHAGEVSSHFDYKSYIDLVKPLKDNISNAQTLVMKVSQAAKDKIARNKKNMGNKNIYFKR